MIQALGLIVVLILSLAYLAVVAGVVYALLLLVAIMWRGGTDEDR